MPADFQSIQHKRKKTITVHSLQLMRDTGEKIAMLTCYDASFAALMDRCGLDVLLIGDSLGMVCQGYSSTLPVKLSDIIYHTTHVARNNQIALIVADMPFGSYITPTSAVKHAVLLMQAGANMVKLEGGSWLFDTVRLLTERGIPVCVHLGLKPQFVHQIGGYKVQGKTPEDSEILQNDAKLMESAGAALLVLETIPAMLGAKITAQVNIPTIGIGAGVSCSGQVLVMHDMLGIESDYKPRFVRNFLLGTSSIEEAILAYVLAVKEKRFPDIEHCF